MTSELLTLPRLFRPVYRRPYHQVSGLQPSASGIGLLSHADVHFGRAERDVVGRQAVLGDAYAAHPERFVRKPLEPPRLPRAVWINKPSTPTEAPQQIPG